MILKDSIDNRWVEKPKEHLISKEGEGFESLFKTHFKALHAYAYTFVKDEMVAEEIVQDLFMKLWEKKSDLNIHTSIKTFKPLDCIIMWQEVYRVFRWQGHLIS